MDFPPSRNFDRMPNTLNVSPLEKSSQPAHEVFFDLIHNCSPEPATRTAMTTALVLSLWQQRAATLSKHVPSLILLNAGKAAPDPVDGFIAKFTHELTDQQLDKTKGRIGVPNDPEKALDLMATSVSARRQLGPAATLDSLDARSAKGWEGWYQDAKRVAFGTGTARPYAKTWSDQFGFLTDENDVLIARLNTEPDRVAFRHDVIKMPNKLRAPIGIGRGLQTVSNKVSVSGSFTADLWDEELVMGIIQLGLPILFTPHIAQEPLALSNRWALDVFSGLWRDAAVSRASTSLMLPPSDWFEAHTEDIRRRLRWLPGPGTYEFAVLQVLHQLGSVCRQIANHACSNHTAQLDDIQTLMWDLQARAFRGITLGVAALAWHGLGFDPGCPREKAVKVLQGLRTKGPMSPNEIRRKYHLESQEQRDTLLERLATEDLVRIEGKTVMATSFEEFVTALQSRPELPEVANFRNPAGGKDQA